MQILAISLEENKRDPVLLRGVFDGYIDWICVTRIRNPESVRFFINEIYLSP